MNKVLQICEKTGFLRAVYSGKSLDYLAFGPNGELLVNNLKEEWIYSCVKNIGTNVFPFYRGSAPTLNICEDTKDSFSYVKKLCKGQLPFGLAEIRQESNEIDTLMGPSKTESERKQDALKLSKGTVLRCIQFLSPDDANRSFTTLQRDRKVWWRKFSSSPGRFKLSEVTMTENGEESNERLQSVQILSDFDWGTSSVETVRLWPPSTFASKEKFFELRDGRRSVLPCVLESVVTLDVAAMVYLCDALDDKTEDNVIMRLHRRIAPIKVSFSSSVSKEVQSKAYALAEHLTVILRRAGHMTLLLPKMREEPLESSLASNNEIGVPFTVVLTDSSLSDGIIQLYSRETSIKEQVHITQLVGYMDQLLKSSS